MSSDFRPSNTERIYGKRELLVLDAWLYQVSQHISLVSVTSPYLDMNDSEKIGFNFILFKNTDASWWFVLVQSKPVPTTWREF